MNGRAVSAEDAAASILRYRDNPLVTEQDLAHDRARQGRGGGRHDPAHHDAPTVRLYASRELGTIGAGAILPKEFVRRTDRSHGASASAAGRSASIEIRPAEHARIARNDDYYRAPVPYLDAMEWTIFASDDARIAAFNARQIDVMPNRDAAEAQAFREVSDDIEVSSEPSLACVSLGHPVRSRAVQRPRVRGAVDLALDRDALIRDIAFGNGEVLGAGEPASRRGLLVVAAKRCARGAQRHSRHRRAPRERTRAR